MSTECVCVWGGRWASNWAPGHQRKGLGQWGMGFWVKSSSRACGMVRALAPEEASGVPVARRHTGELGRSPSHGSFTCVSDRHGVLAPALQCWRLAPQHERAHGVWCRGQTGTHEQLLAMETGGHVSGRQRLPRRNPVLAPLLTNLSASVSSSVMGRESNLLFRVLFLGQRCCLQVTLHDSQHTAALGELQLLQKPVESPAGAYEMTGDSNFLAES